MSCPMSETANSAAETDTPAGHRVSPDLEAEADRVFSAGDKAATVRSALTSWCNSQSPVNPQQRFSWHAKRWRR